MRHAVFALLAVAVVPAVYFVSAESRAGEPEFDAAPALKLQAFPSASRHPIDSFAAAWRERRLSPSPPAERRTLLRRLSLDLRGLPLSEQKLYELEPSDESQHAGAPDASTAPDAVDRYVDRWLASSSFDGRWGRHRLDLARYSDSTGFETDAPRMHWKYRDWVLDAVNRDLPFDALVVERGAGTPLPNLWRLATTLCAFITLVLCHTESVGLRSALTTRRANAKCADDR